jgi:hypothetical protein
VDTVHDICIANHRRDDMPRFALVRKRLSRTVRQLAFPSLFHFLLIVFAALDTNFECLLLE